VDAYRFRWALGVSKMTLYEFEYQNVHLTNLDEINAKLDEQNKLLEAIAHNLIEVSKYFRNKNDEANYQ
jgi:hypothetical protein